MVVSPIGLLSQPVRRPVDKACCPVQEPAPTLSLHTAVKNVSERAKKQKHAKPRNAQVWSHTHSSYSKLNIIKVQIGGKHINLSNESFFNLFSTEIFQI